MDSPDSGSGAVPLLPLWRAVSGRLAVAAGAATALTSLLNDVPVSRACLRGGLAWLLTRLVAGGAGWLLARTTLDRETEGQESPEEGEAPTDGVEAA